MNKRELARRQAWMRKFNDTLVAEVPAISGRVDWDTATFCFNEGQDAIEVAKRMAERLREEWSKAPRNTGF